MFQSFSVLLGWCLCFAAGIAAVEGERPRPGTVVWRLDAAEQARMTLPKEAQWCDDGPAGARSLHLTVPRGPGGNQTWATLPIDLRPWRGTQLALVCSMRADAVSAPRDAWNGIKCMLRVASPHGDRYMNQGDLHGTFGWREVECQIPLDDDVTTGTLHLGLQDCHGAVAFADVRLVTLRVKPQRPEPRADAPPPFRGHDLPRLRGVMSPDVYKEDDFAALAAWNVNVIRWQMRTSWETVPTDTDLELYEKWLADELDDAERALDGAHRHGLLLMLDMHSPPGGRLPDGTLAMVLERRYQDHFVDVWTRIATRFAGHPALWAYDLVNEPLQDRPSPPDCDDWLQVQVRAAKAVRVIDAKTAIVIAVDQWDSPGAFAWMEPIDVPNVIYQVHMYWPGAYTHQGVGNDWGERGQKERIAYPGTHEGQPFDAAALRAVLEPVRTFQRAHNVHIVVGEFSAIRWAPGADRYLGDCVAIFEEYGWDWMYHAWREWPGWSLEHADAPADRSTHVRAMELTARAKALRHWFDQNVRPPRP